jgi:undecaprenyl-diphosphatase
VIEIFILSVIQGITEFLPIISSSHLILASEYLNFSHQNLSIDVSLHVGSFIAVISYFYKDIINFYENKILFIKIFISSLPVMLIGLLLLETNYIEKIRNIETIAWTTIVFGILLFISDKFTLKKNIKDNLTFKSAIFIGVLQIFSLIPGVSRSGIAITAARLLKFERVDAAKISFLLSIPILAAVSIYGLKNILFSESMNFTRLNLMAIILSFIFSFVTIKFFLQFIKKFSLNTFVYYRIFLGFALLVIAYL